MAVLSNTPLVRKTYDDADDAIWFDPTLCALDAPGIDACNRYNFVDDADAVPRVLLDKIRSFEVAEGTTELRVNVTGTIFPRGTQAEFSPDAGQTWYPLATDGQCRVDDVVPMLIDGTVGVGDEAIMARAAGSSDHSVMDFTVAVTV